MKKMLPLMSTTHHATYHGTRIATHVQRMCVAIHTSTSPVFTTSTLTSCPRRGKANINTKLKHAWDTKLLSFYPTNGNDGKANMTTQASAASDLVPYTTKDGKIPMATSTASSQRTIAKPFKEMPGPKGIYNLPYIGFLFHLKPFSNYTTRTIHLLMDEMVDRYGSTFYVRTNVPTIVITDPKDYATLVRQEGKYPARPNIDILEAYHKRTGVPRGIGAVQGPDWLRLRQPIQKILLTPKKLACYLPFMNEVVDEFIEMLASGYLKKHDVNRAFMDFMAESVGTAFFSKRLGFLDDVQSDDMKMMHQSTHDLFDIVQKTLTGASNSFKIYRSKDYRKFESGYNFLNRQIIKLVREEKDHMASRRQKMGVDVSVEKPSILRSLLEKTTEQDTNLIMETLFPAAIDSSAAAIQLVLHTLATHPLKQEKLRQEIYQVLDNDPNTTHDGGVVGPNWNNSKNNNNIVVTQEHLDKMNYLKAVLKESFRYRNVSMLTTTRILPNDVVLGGYNVPAGVQVMYINSKASRDAAIFENPDKFEPERWLRSNNNNYNSSTARKETWSNDNNNNNNAMTTDGQGLTSSSSRLNNRDISWAVQPFGVGSRSCPGRRMFEQETYLFLAKLLYKFGVGLEPDSRDAEFEYRVFVRFVQPPKFVFTPIPPRTI